jgi:hypothetical protein
MKTRLFFLFLIFISFLSLDLSNDIKDAVVHEEIIEEKTSFPVIDEIPSAIINEDEAYDQHESEVISELLDIQQAEQQEMMAEEQEIIHDSMQAAEAERLAQATEQQHRDEHIREKLSVASDDDKISSSGSKSQPRGHFGGSRVQMKSSTTTGTPAASEPGDIPASTQQYSFKELLSRFQKKSDPASPIVDSTSSTSSMSKLENILRREQNSQQNRLKSHSVAKQQELLARLRRYEYPRELARPIEFIINCYEDEDCSYYHIFRLSDRQADLDEKNLRQVYRNIALQIHPDKNPHPDAKYAFDILYDAYDTLANESSRESYNQQLASQRKRKKLTWKKLKKQINNKWVNFHARVLQFIYRLKNHELNAELEEFLESPKMILRGWQHKIQHICLLPSAYDRVVFLHEILYHHATVTWFWIEIIAWFFEKQVLSLITL